MPIVLDIGRVCIVHMTFEQVCTGETVHQTLLTASPDGLAMFAVWACVHIICGLFARGYRYYQRQILSRTFLCYSLALTMFVSGVFNLGMLIGYCSGSEFY